MPLFDGGYHAEPGGQGLESFLLGGLGKALVHIGPLIVLAVGCCGQILCGVAYALKLLEPEFGVLLLVLCGLQEDGCHLLEALFFGYGCKIGVLVSRLRFAGERCFQILFGLGA